MTGPFALWLVPDEVAARVLSGLIARLAAPVGSPLFAPHLTLLGSLRVPEHALRAGLSAVAAGTPPLTLRVTGPAHGDAYLRCVYLEVDGGAALADVRARATAAFDIAAPGAFEPHISLLYGRLDAATRRQVLVEIRGELPGRVTLQRLEAWFTGGRVADWRPVASVPLAG